MNDKDQAAIDHVASVSKHPHAAMIVKWLITGWDVEFEYAIGEWKISDFPTWSPGSKYRLIEPKPAKPAYRVYLGKDGEPPETVTRDLYEKYRSSYDGKVRWISDWIEYTKWPTPLVERIAAIDLEAAQWIVDHWDDLLDDKYAQNGMHSRDSDGLIFMFCWKASPQGVQYWNDIDNKLQ